MASRIQKALYSYPPELILGSMSTLDIPCVTLYCMKTVPRGSEYRAIYVTDVTFVFVFVFKCNVFNVEYLCQSTCTQNRELQFHVQFDFLYYKIAFWTFKFVFFARRRPTMVGGARPLQLRAFAALASRAGCFRSFKPISEEQPLSQPRGTFAALSPNRPRLSHTCPPWNDDERAQDGARVCYSYSYCN